MRLIRVLFAFTLLTTLMSADINLSYAGNVTNSNKILVLYKERDPDHVGIVQILTNYLSQAGYAYESRDVEQLLVDNPDTSSYIGIMTAYQTSQMINGDKYPAWLVTQMEAGKRILIIGSYGAYQGRVKNKHSEYVEWNESTQTINTFFHPFGLEFYFAFTGNNSLLQLVKADKDYAQFEEPITQKNLNYYQLFKSVNRDNKIYFSVKRKDIVDSESAFNVITPFGGMILEGYSYFWDPVRKKNIARVNFPKFMKQVFSAKSPEVPKFKIQTHADLVKKYPLPDRPAPTLLPDAEKIDNEISRRVLVVYKKSEAPNLEEMPFYNRCSLILEYYGLIPVYRAVEDGLPDDSFMNNFYGIATWHTKIHMAHAQEYGDWLYRQIANGKHIVMLQEYGASIDSGTEEPVTNQAKVFAALGIKYERHENKRLSSSPVLRYMDKFMLGYEKKFDPESITFSDAYKSIDSNNKVFLSYTDKELGIVDLGIITKNGGVSLEQTPYYFPSYDSERVALIRKALNGSVAPEVAEQETLGAWYLNPFMFFSAAFDLKDYPAPDVTTLNGSRIFYAHIDGDGLDSVSLIDGAHSAGFKVYEEVLKKYTNIPTTVSVITKFVERAGNEYHHPNVVLARNIYRLPNVDMAVHAATHPFDWVGGDPYIVNPDSYPYKIGYRKHNLLEEIWGAKLFADINLAPDGKKTTTLFWSGATNPDENALEIVWRSGMHNLNGGDPRFDDEYPSLSGLTPYELPFGPYRQYFTSAQNDYIYTLYLTGDWGGQKKLLQHFEKTDKPYRVYPMNLYYHFYSGIKTDSMEALHYIYSYIDSIDAASMYATNYLEIIEDFYQTRIGFDGKAYWIKNNGFLRTIRFNKPTHVNVKESQGVLGYLISNDKTYVHMDGSKNHKIVLSRSQPSIPYFIQATQFIDSSYYSGNKLLFDLRGFGNTLLKIGGLKPKTLYTISLHSSTADMKTSQVRSNAEGIVEYRTILPAPVARYKGTVK